MEKKIKIYLIAIFIVLGVIGTICVFDGSDIEASTKKISSKSSTVYVDIKGAVKSPGVYEISSKSRIVDVIEKAGGVTSDADTSIINLSKKVTDEMYIIIYTKDEVLAYKDGSTSSSEVTSKIEENLVCPDSDNDGCISNSTKTTSNSNKTNSSKININTASIEELTTLTGIGEAKAKKIIEYREKNKFSNIKDITNVSGIGTSIYEKNKNNIEI